MRNVPAALQTALDAGVTTLARLWTISRSDGVVYRYTDHDQPITSGGNVFEPSVGFEASSVLVAASSKFQGLAITFGDDDSTISADDIRNNLFDGATSTVELVNWAAPANGTMVLFDGTVKKAEWSRGTHKAVFTIGNRFDTGQDIADEVYSSICRADLGDSRCGYDIVSASVPISVASVTNAQRFAINEVLATDRKWNNGLLVWTNGPNTGLAVEVAKHDDGTNELYLVLPLAYLPLVGNTATLYPGCDKTHTTCKFYNNLVNFRGEPFLAMLTDHSDESEA